MSSRVSSEGLCLDGLAVYDARMGNRPDHCQPFTTGGAGTQHRMETRILAHENKFSKFFSLTDEYTRGSPWELLPHLVVTEAQFRVRRCQCDLASSYTSMNFDQRSSLVTARCGSDFR